MQHLLRERLYGFALIGASALVCFLIGDCTVMFFTLPLGIMVIVKPEIAVVRRSIRPERTNDMTQVFEIRSVRGHYEIYVDGEFLCSGDTPAECLEALDETPLDAA